MFLFALWRENRRIDTLSIIPHPQPEAVIVVTDFDLDLLCACMKKGIAECFSSNLIHLVAKDGMHISRLALNGYTEFRAGARRVRCEFFSERAYRQCQVVGLSRRIA